MDGRIHETRQRYLVVATNVLIAEDLREILAELGGMTVDVCRSLDDPWSGPYAAAFFSMSSASVFESERVRTLGERGTRIIVVDDDYASRSIPAFEVLNLNIPFRTEDVLLLLETAGLRQDSR